MLNAKHLQRIGTKKLQSKKVGPYTVKWKINETTYELNLPEHMNIWPIFNKSLLTPYKEDPKHQQEEEGPILIDGQEEYEVEKVLKECLTWNKINLLVRWKGYGPEHDTWQTLDTLTNAADIVAQHYKQHPTQFNSKQNEVQEWINKFTNPNPHTWSTKRA